MRRLLTIAVVTAATVLAFGVSVAAAKGPVPPPEHPGAEEGPTPEATTPPRAGGTCRVPRLTGLTLTVARKRAADAGCTLRVKGARLEQAAIQTVERQVHARTEAA